MSESDAPATDAAALGFFRERFGLDDRSLDAALGTALVVYTATHISEIVRGSILAVHKGQVEAANALALSGVQRYRFVILPQAMRIAFPPLINQFLNFSKNSSLPSGMYSTLSSQRPLSVFTGWRSCSLGWRTTAVEIGAPATSVTWTVTMIPGVSWA